MDYTLPRENRRYFKEPFGPLYSSVEDAMDVIRGRMVIAVGDMVTRNLLIAGITPDVAVIDGITMRSPCRETPLLSSRRIEVANPPGMLTGELIAALDEGVAASPVLVFVDGEEDLAVIPAVLAAPDGAVVLYGQPCEGVVALLVDAERKRKAEWLLSLFEKSDEVDHDF
ncbi:hypothetical protein AZH53_10485 [Methanomicrobiaceae archaeon CYW5]|uniref:GTP-dependent dephospho-CoA kinase family protein n=1 Tax=Methanovulcanius yangii TaxID=1789227 RepID=UPI0029CA73BF|nr:GTP-dependent dephospho-CoA kinase family protein [Methanovulcanius yangii]MBT8508832.1 hypothetical protein [Methanovulcanius yangii]